MTSSSSPEAEKHISDEASLWIVRLNSGEATQEDRKNAAQWRAADPRHEAAFRTAEKAWKQTADLRQDPASGMAHPKPQRHKSPPKKLSLLIAGGLIAALAVWSLRGTPHDFKAGTAEIRTITLPDGSTITLEARSAIDIDFTPNQRRISLASGGAYFEVRNAKERPFVVQTGDAQITALGTAFTVRNTGVAGETEVTVTQHSVEVMSQNRNLPAVTLRENQNVLVNGVGIGAIGHADAEAALAWRKGLLIAEDRRLGRVIDELRRYYSGWIVVTDAKAENLRVNAVLDLRQTGVSLETLAAGLPITMRFVSPYLVIVSSR